MPVGLALLALPGPAGSSAQHLIYRDAPARADAPAIFAHRAARKPTVVLYTATPATLPAAGGAVRLAARVRDATHCSFSSSPRLRPLPESHACDSGHAVVTLTVGANTSTSARTLRFTLAVSGKGGVHAASSVRVIEDAHVAAPAPAGDPSASQAPTTPSAAPRVTADPADATVVAGSVVDLTAAASGNPNPSVEWELSSDGGSDWTTIIGATATSYSFTALAAQSGYVYRAVFTNGLGSATTSAATVTVLTPPQVTTQPSDYETYAGQNATFTATASGDPAPAVQWYSSANGTDWTAIPGQTSTSYTAQNVTTADDGTEYQAIFTNSAGTATSDPATLTVTADPAAPAVTQQPADQVALSGDTATFTAAASGSPTPAVQWEVSSNGTDWTAISGASSDSYSFVVQGADSTNLYRATFSNGVSPAATTNAVTIITPQETSNWSGYAATGETFSAVSASWTVPAVSCPSSATSYSSDWIGIDGDLSDTVEQDGTEADCNGTNNPSYDAWFEMYGDNSPDVDYGDEVELDPSAYPVQPGDAISATVSVAGDVWTLAISDSSEDPAWSYSTNVTFAGAGQSSVEWIGERPELCYSNNDCQLTPLADFGTLDFSAASATGNGVSGPISSFDYAPLEMVGNSGALAVPGPLDPSGEQFTDTWRASS